MTTFLLSSPSYFQQATRADVTCDGETNSALTLLITSGAGDDHRGVGSRRLNDPMILFFTKSEERRKEAKRHDRVGTPRRPTVHLISRPRRALVRYLITSFRVSVTAAAEHLAAYGAHG
jgi:hypothetical protein